MPSLIRFIAVLAVLAALVLGSLYVLAVYFEPQQKETTSPIGDVKVRKQ
jgi:phage shock protein PspC (stress-responsive transcriptional regulator)